MNEPKWLRWSRKIQALSQSGLLYSDNEFDRERYHELSDLAAKMAAEECGMAGEEIKVLFDAQEGYATPRVDIRGVVFKNDSILLVRELMDGGRWTLPGGWVDVDEPPSLAVERELQEEAGVIARAKKLLAVYDRNLHGHPYYYFHIYKLFFLCDLLGETVASPLETSSPTFFRETEIPELSLGRVTPEEITRFFEHHRNPSLPTDFD